MKIDNDIALIEKELDTASKMVVACEQRLVALRRAKSTIQLVNQAVNLAWDRANRPLVPNWKSTTTHNYLAEHCTYIVSLPRASGKTTAFNYLKEDERRDGLIFASKGDFTCNHRGKRYPWGPSAKVLVFDDDYTDEVKNDIASNWIYYGYKQYPVIVSICTLR